MNKRALFVAVGLAATSQLAFWLPGMPWAVRWSAVAPGNWLFQIICDLPGVPMGHAVKLLKLNPAAVMVYSGLVLGAMFWLAFGYALFALLAKIGHRRASLASVGRERRSTSTR